jgi:hypothetical protein
MIEGKVTLADIEADMHTRAAARIDLIDFINII